MRDVLTEPITLLSLTITLGLLLGRLRIRRFSLGSSGTLFVGLLVGWLVIHTADEETARSMLSQGVIEANLFRLALALFIASVGLSAARYLDKVLKVYGVKLLLLGVLVPAVGAAAAWGFGRLIPGMIPTAIPGAFTGSLTSSPGLAAALEQVAGQGAEIEGIVGFGYAVAYIPGVLIVVLAMQLIPVIFRMNHDDENLAFCVDLDVDPNAPTEDSGHFRPLEFFLVIALGTLVGAVEIPLSSVGRIGLGTTGGVLAIGLLVAFKGAIGPLEFRMPAAALSAVRELGIALFLSVVGLRYGYTAIDSMAQGGLSLLALSVGVAMPAIAVGFVVGRYVLKMNWILLAGALCGAMTSTPGLGAAMEATGCDDVATGYGAVYPIALLTMVILTIFLSAV
jgi:putative transport protein